MILYSIIRAMKPMKSSKGMPFETVKYLIGEDIF